MENKHKTTLIVICIIFIFIIAELSLELFRGYGFIGGADRLLSLPRFQAFSGLSRISSAVEEAGYYDVIPKINDLMKNSKEIVLSESQPFERFGISVINWKGSNEKIYEYLYASVLTFEEQSLTYKKGEISSIIYATSLGRWDDKRNCYVSFTEYPERVENELSNHWLYTGIMVNGEITSNIPLVPGCLVIADDVKGRNAKIYYPRKLMPAVKAIYPKLNIPEDSIIELEYQKSNMQK